MPSLLKINLKEAPMVSTSKGKKIKSNRQVFFSALMKRLAGDQGNEVADAFVKNDKDKFKSMMDEISSQMAKVDD